MRTPRLLLAGATLAEGAVLALPRDRHHYLTRVLRRAPGDAVEVFDGAGQAAPAVLCDDGSIEVTATPAQEPAPALATTLGLALSRGERMDTALQKATELGASRIDLLLTERVEVRLPAARLAKRMAHWQGVVASACEQCGRNRLPPLHPPQPLTEWLAADAAPGILLHPEGASLRDLDPPAGALRLATGPEGGFTAAERAAATANGFTQVRLGPRVLRAETAPLAALAAVQLLWGDLG